jgi:surface antigen
MNAKKWIGGLLLLGACGCNSMNNTERGALGGGALGAGAGALLGAATGHAGAGAAIGAGVGAVTGGLIGNSEDRAESRQKRSAEAWAAQHPPMGIPDIVQLSQQHISDELIIGQIRNSSSAYALTANDITYMRQQGVSERVIGYMLGRTAPATMVVPGRTVYVMEPPPPPVAVGVGIGYGRRW